jgi:hypothetical protein
MSSINAEHPPHEISDAAYCKMILHACKYAARPIFGVLLGATRRDQQRAHKEGGTPTHSGGGGGGAAAPAAKSEDAGGGGGGGSVAAAVAKVESKEHAHAHVRLHDTIADVVPLFHHYPMAPMTELAMIQVAAARTTIRGGGAYARAHEWRG